MEAIGSGPGRWRTWMWAMMVTTSSVACGRVDFQKPTDAGPFDAVPAQTLRCSSESGFCRLRCREADCDSECADRTRCIVTTRNEAESLQATCIDEATCTIHPNSVSVDVRCADQTSCWVHCRDAQRCSLRCEGSARCEVDCGASETCTLSCGPRAECALDCDRAERCELDGCPPEDLRSCESEDALACRGACP